MWRDLARLGRRMTTTIPASSRIFVFGSNLAGRHGKGAALQAKNAHGAVYGVGSGPTGNAYAIPTKDQSLQPLPLADIARHIQDFIDYARGLAITRPEVKFSITRVGCGLAGFQDDEIAPLFADAPGNCLLPMGWRTILSGSAPLLYTGIGSRQTPPEMLAYMRKLAERLAVNGFMLRSGAADGADSAFEDGSRVAGGAAEIWLPWKGFQGRTEGSFAGPLHRKIASTLHPRWATLKPGAQSLHARNVGQVLGADCATPAAFVVCWTQDGCQTGVERSSKTGGTGLAIDLADRQAVPVFNLAREGARERLFAKVQAILAQRQVDEEQPEEGPRDRL